MLSVRHLNFSYGNRRILKDISLDVKPAQVISLLGPNGSGKSTLLRCMSRLLPVTSGELRLHGKPVSQHGSREFAKEVAFLPQTQDIVRGLTVYEFVLLGRSPHHRSGWFISKEDQKKVCWAIDYMNLGLLRDRQMDNLSGGERQRVRIAMTLAQDTPYILLDEPVTYMDIKYQAELLKTIRNLKDSFGKTVIAVFHDMNHAIEISDRICLLKNGTILGEGPVDEIITEQKIRETYEICAHVCKVSCCKRSVVIPFGIDRGSQQETGERDSGQSQKYVLAKEI